MFDPAWSAALACRRRRARHRNFCKHSPRISQIAGRCLARSPLAHHGRGQPNFDAADQYSPATRTTAKHFIRTLSMNCLPRGIVKSSAGAGTIPSIRRASFSPLRSCRFVFSGITYRSSSKNLARSRAGFEFVARCYLPHWEAAVLSLNLRLQSLFLGAGSRCLELGEGVYSNSIVCGKVAAR